MLLLKASSLDPKKLDLALEGTESGAEYEKEIRFQLEAHCALGLRQSHPKAVCDLDWTLLSVSRCIDFVEPADISVWRIVFGASHHVEEHAGSGSPLHPKVNAQCWSESDHW